jgi:hypothetical protein
MLMLTLMLNFLLPCYSLLDPTSHETQLTAGKMQYELVAREASRPRYGPCWRQALASLEAGCKNLDDEMQSRLALNFANCFLEKSGQNVFPCGVDTEISSCLEDVDNNAFTAYSNFFTHTQNMCYFLQSQAWQEDTENTIHNLAANSALVSESLAESQKLQETIVMGQQQSLEYQKQLIENGSYLSRAIEASKGNVKEMLEEFKLSTSEQKTLIFEVFDRVSRLQNLVLSEVSWLYTVVFYSACLLAIYLITATRRTADARLWLFIILSINFAVERLVVKISLPSEGHEVMDLSQVVHHRVWMVRHVAIGLGTIILAIIAIKFKDYNKINNTLLEEIKRQNLELKRSMETFQVGNKPPVPLNSFPGSVDTLDGLLSPLSQLLAEDTGFAGDEENYSDEDSDSFNSTKTDTTFNPGSRDQSSDDEFGTAANSRDTTPVNDEIDAAMEALNSSLVTSCHRPIVQSTPVKTNPPDKSKDSRSRKVMVKLNNHVDRRYNLRSRNKSGSSTSSVDRKADPDVKESPEAFGKLVRQHLGRSKRNFAKLKMAVRKDTEAGDYSSDDL